MPASSTAAALSAALDAPTTSPVVAPGRRHGLFHPLTIESVERLTDDAVTITFAVPEELRAVYRFLPGQHLTLRTTVAGVEVRRNYSICSPATEQRLRIAVKHLEGGVFSGLANATLHVGDVVDVMTPTGRFTVVPDPALARHYCALAAGSGITPVISIIATALEVERRSTVTLFYGNRTTASIMFLEELQDLKNRYPCRFTLLNVLSREPQDVELLSGRLDGPKVERLLDTLVPVDTVDEWLLCGPFEMVATARDLLLKRGVDPHHVHQELFHVDGEARRPIGPAGPSTPIGRAPVTTVTATLEGRTSVLDMSPGVGSILDALLAVRSDAPYACKGGVCGTCRARLVAGSVAMDRNYALEPDEVDDGFVLACQAHPTSRRVTLDFDQ